MAKFDPTKHELVPKHSKASDKEKKDILERYQITLRELPKILATDPAIQHLDVKEGDLVKITRASQTAGESTYYRRIAA
ncbi:DNA-directed RNA polymerase subunit H [Candidatus Woesearchaeota archaeon]|nr:DNA-directed RNA polymerase subunit H [Candidatus Woesearchaeota archaeon]